MLSVTICRDALASPWMRRLSASPNPSDSSTASVTTRAPNTQAIWVRRLRPEMREGRVFNGTDGVLQGACCPGRALAPS